MLITPPPLEVSYAHHSSTTRGVLCSEALCSIVSITVAMVTRVSVRSINQFDESSFFAREDALFGFENRTEVVKCIKKPS